MHWKTTKISKFPAYGAEPPRYHGLKTTHLEDCGMPRRTRFWCRGQGSEGGTCGDEGELGMYITAVHPWKLTCHLKRSHFKRKGSFSNHHISGDMLVFAGVLVISCNFLIQKSNPPKSNHHIAVSLQLLWLFIRNITNPWRGILHAAFAPILRETIVIYSKGFVPRISHGPKSLKCQTSSESLWLSYPEMPWWESPPESWKRQTCGNIEGGCGVRHSWYCLHGAMAVKWQSCRRFLDHSNCHPLIRYQAFAKDDLIFLIFCVWNNRGNRFEYTSVQFLITEGSCWRTASLWPWYNSVGTWLVIIYLFLLFNRGDGGMPRANLKKVLVILTSFFLGPWWSNFEPEETMNDI